MIEQDILLTKERHRIVWPFSRLDAMTTYERLETIEPVDLKFVICNLQQTNLEDRSPSVIGVLVQLPAFGKYVR